MESILSDPIREKWNLIKETIRKEYELSNISYSTWIEPLKFYKVDGDNVLIIIPIDQAHAINYISNKYTSFFQVTITEMMDKNYTVSFILEKDIEDEVKAFQKNMSTALKKEWYITFHTSENAIVVFREKIFVMSCKGIVPVYKKRIDTSHAKDKQRWDDMIQYAKSLGVPDEQCDFLPEDFTKQEY